MAEYVEQRMEEMIPEVEELERVGILESQEVKELVKRRKHFEYKIHKRQKQKEDLLAYIQYEINLKNLIFLRRQKIRYHNKKDIIERAINQRVNRMFVILTTRWPTDVKLWLSHIDWMKEVKWIHSIGKTYMRLLQVHNQDPKLWIAAAKYEFESGSADNGRKIMLRALRFLPKSKVLHREFIKFELLFVEELAARGRVFKLDYLSKDLNEIDADGKDEANSDIEKEDKEEINDDGERNLEENDDEQSDEEENEIKIYDDTSSKDEAENENKEEEASSIDQEENDEKSPSDIEDDKDESSNEEENHDKEKNEDDVSASDQEENEKNDDKTSSRDIEDDKDESSNEEENDDEEKNEDDVSSSDQEENEKNDDKKSSSDIEDNEDKSSKDEEENEDIEMNNDDEKSLDVEGNENKEIKNENEESSSDEEAENEKKEEKKEKIVKKKDEVTDNILKCELVKIVLQSALEAIPEPEFAVSILVSIRVFKFSKGVQETILQILESKFGDHPVTVDTRARLVLQKDGKAIDLIQESINIYKAGLDANPSSDLLHLYFTTLKDLANKVRTCTLTLCNAMFDLLQYGDKNDFLNSEEYEFYLGLISHDDKQVDDILTRALDRIPGSLNLWAMKLQRCVAMKDDSSGQVLLAAYAGLQNTSDKTKIWLRYLKFMTNHGQSQEAFAFLEHQTEKMNLAFLRVILLDRAYERGIDKAREVYQKFKSSPPFGKNLHKNMLMYELEQTKVDKNRVKEIHGLRTSHFGSDDIEVWLDWIHWEEKSGKVMDVPSIVCRAEANLKPDLVPKFATIREMAL